MSSETVGIILFVVCEAIASFFLFWVLFIKMDEDFEKWRKITRIEYGKEEEIIRDDSL